MPATGGLVPAGLAPLGLTDVVALPLADGRVLVEGRGWGGPESLGATWDPATGIFTTVWQRDDRAGLLALPDGRVLVVWAGRACGNAPSLRGPAGCPPSDGTVQIWDPTSAAFEAAGAVGQDRFWRPLPHHAGRRSRAAGRGRRDGRPGTQRRSRSRRARPFPMPPTRPSPRSEMGACWWPAAVPVGTVSAVRWRAPRSGQPLADPHHREPQRVERCPRSEAGARRQACPAARSASSAPRSKRIGPSLCARPAFRSGATAVWASRDLPTTRPGTAHPARPPRPARFVQPLPPRPRRRHE